MRIFRIQNTDGLTWHRGHRLWVSGVGSVFSNAGDAWRELRRVAAAPSVRVVPFMLTKMTATEVASLKEARDSFSQLINRVESMGERVTFTRRGVPVAVLTAVVEVDPPRETFEEVDRHHPACECGHEDTAVGQECESCGRVRRS